MAGLILMILSSKLDIVLAAVHSHFQLEKDKQTLRMLRALDNKYVNILAHPSGRLISARSPIQLDLESIFKKAIEKNIFLEINTHGERIDLNAVNCRLAKISRREIRDKYRQPSCGRAR